MNRYRWIALDADGTLFDFERAQERALGNAFLRYGLRLDAEAYRVFRQINHGLWARFEAGTITSERLRIQRFEDLARALGASFAAEEFSERYLDDLGAQSLLFDLAAEVVHSLARRASLVLATNGIARVQRSRFAASGIDHHFSGLVISEEVGAAKPATLFFDALLEEMGEPARDEVLMVGDSLSADIAGGIRSGIDTCWYNPGCRRNDSDHRPTYEARSLSDLLEIVGGV